MRPGPTDPHAKPALLKVHNPGPDPERALVIWMPVHSRFSLLQGHAAVQEAGIS